MRAIFATLVAKRAVTASPSLSADRSPPHQQRHDHCDIAIGGRRAAVAVNRNQHFCTPIPPQIEREAALVCARLNDPDQSTGGLDVDQRHDYAIGPHR